MEGAADAQLHSLACPACRGLLEEPVNGGALPRDDDLARAVVVGRPDVLDAGAELLGERILEPEHGGHGARMVPRGVRRRTTARADECDRIAV